MPYQEFRKLFSHQEPPSRWERIRLGSPTRWTVVCALIVIAGLLIR
jgi:hypothetical protein